MRSNTATQKIFTTNPANIYRKGLLSRQSRVPVLTMSVLLITPTSYTIALGPEAKENIIANVQHTVTGRITRSGFIPMDMAFGEN